jgi:type I restriction enzyme S subunit
VFLAEVEGLASAEFLVLQSSDAIEPEYLRRRIMALDFLDFTAALDRGDRPRVEYQQICKFDLTLPPIAEQRRIVAKLDSLTARTGRARSELDHIPKLIAKYKQAILAKAFSGGLTKDWRIGRESVPGITLRDEVLSKRAAKLREFGLKHTNADLDFSGESACPKLPVSWTWMPVAALASKVADGVHKKPNYVEVGIPFVTVRNLTAGRSIDFGTCRFITKADHDEFSKRAPVDFGDILITKDGTLGVVRAVRTKTKFSIFVSVALVKPVDGSMTDYLELALQAPIVQNQMVGVGSGLQHIHLTDLRKDMIPVAPPEERKEIVRRIEAAFAWLDKVAAEHARATHLLPKLDQGILAKAFRGELVPQDPNDEPASVLLDRIKAERLSKSSGSGRGRKRATAKS